MILNGLGFNQVESRAVATALFGWFFLSQFSVNDRLTDPDTGVANEHAGWTGDHLSNFTLRFPAKRAEVDLGRLSHNQ
jgi:hypothetical protein